MAKYKVGDKVRVRSDLRLGEYYGLSSFVEPMKVHLGKEVTISLADEYETYKIKNDKGCWWWSNEMFEGLAEEPEFHVYDTVKHEKYGIGTVIETAELDSGKKILLIEFDEWNEEFPNYNENTIWVEFDTLTVIQSYIPN